MRNLTDKQSDILHYLAEFIHANGYAPCIREIGAHFSITSNRGVTVHLDALQRKGCITRGNKARQIVLTQNGKRPPTVAAGSVPFLPSETDACEHTARAIIDRIREEAGRWQPGGSAATVLYALASKLTTDYLEAE